MKIYATVLGGSAQTFERADFTELGVEITVGGLEELMDLGDGAYVATVNEETRDSEFELSDGDFVTFAPAVKGGR